MSGAGNSLQQLFKHAAALLLGNVSDAAADHDAQQLLQSLDYTAVEPAAGGDRITPDMANRAQLLMAASRFARVFELSAPDAPGLIAFGAQFEPALADSLHAESPMVGVSGVGLTLREAFQGCIGEGVEYLSQLQHQSDQLLTGTDERVGGLGPRTMELVAALSERRTDPQKPMSLHRVINLADGSDAWLPADICIRRPPAQRDFTPPFPLSIGSAAGPAREAAALHGLLELIERDATALWWRGGLFGRSIPPYHPAAALAENLLRQLRQGTASPRRTWLLDITTDIGVPCTAAVSCRADGSGFVFGLAARPKLEAAVRSAIIEMCQGELADAVVATKLGERGEDALNVHDRIHLQRARVNADRCALLQPLPEYAAHIDFDATEASVIFAMIVQRLHALGIETFFLDLTRAQFAVPVIRVIAPGLQLEPSEIVTARLRDAIARTGGGATYTGGVALM